MLAFDLCCSNGHNFEGWFKDLESFEEQSRQGLIQCPLCMSIDVARTLSPLTIKTSKAEKKLDRVHPDVQRLAYGIMEYIKKNFDDVGSDFARETLKMHYGVKEKKNIRGSATPEEEKLLKEEGINFIKMPFLKTKDDKN